MATRKRRNKAYQVEPEIYEARWQKNKTRMRHYGVEAAPIINQLSDLRGPVGDRNLPLVNDDIDYTMPSIEEARGYGGVSSFFNRAFSITYVSCAQKTQNDFLREFEPRSSQMLQHLLSGYGLPVDLKCRRCQLVPGRWRCRQCFGNTLFCRKCCRGKHQEDPFHEIEVWVGQYFMRASLWEVGVRLYAGHGFVPCPAQAFAVGVLDAGEMKRDLEDLRETERLYEVSSTAMDVDMGDDTPHMDTGAAPMSATSDNFPEVAGRSTGKGPSMIPGSERNPNLHSTSMEPSGGTELGEYQQASIGIEAMAEDPDDDEDWEDLEELPIAPPFHRPAPKSDDCGNSFVTIVDVTGIHELPLLDCACMPVQDPDRDFMAISLFPGSFRRVKTLFTFGLLDDFRMSNLECKTTPYQYYQKLRRITCSAFPATVPNRYAELRRLAREWRLLKKHKWHGVGHDPTPRPPGGLALFCAACPQPSVNLGDAWKDDPDKYVP